MQSVQQTLEAFEIYKNSEFSALQAQKSQKATEEIAVTAPAAKPQEETKEMLVGAHCEKTKPTSTQTQPSGAVDNKVVECSILHSAPIPTLNQGTQATNASPKSLNKLSNC